MIDNEDAAPKKVSVVHGKNVILPAELFESFGTIRFMNVFPCILNALVTGGVLVMDEFDASLHPVAIMSLINAFHNDEVNKFGAQLIFNTHNPIFLKSNLFRRDEIKFIDSDETTQVSEHYSLSDFGTSGENRVNKHGDYMKNYFVSRFGAIKNVDFTDILKEMVNNSVGSGIDDSEKT